MSLETRIDMKKYIHINKETREYIMKELGITQRMVFKALHFQGTSDLAKKIQQIAYEHGGILMNVLPCVQTLHDADGYMRQYLPNGAMLEFSKHDSSGDVYFKGESVRHYEQVYMSQIEGIQSWAMALR